MRKMILLSLIIGILGSCIPVDYEAPKPFIKVVQIDSISKNEAYILANEWMVESFGDAKSVIEFSDKEAGIIKGKYLMKEGRTATEYIPKIASRFSIITVKVRDNAARMEITPIGRFYTQKMYGLELGFTPTEFQNRAKSLSLSFVDRMTKKVSSDW